MLRRAFLKAAALSPIVALVPKRSELILCDAAKSHPVIKGPGWVEFDDEIWDQYSGQTVRHRMYADDPT